MRGRGVRELASGGKQTFSCGPTLTLRYLNVMSGESIGTLLFVAVALHNVPIAAMVAATPIAASGSRWKAVLAAAIVGSAFPLAGLLAFAAGDRLASPTVTAVTFALTAGILVFVCVTELLPKVFLEDPSPHKRVATTAIFSGMVVMGIVMVLLAEFGGHMH